MQADLPSYESSVKDVHQKFIKCTDNKNKAISLFSYLSCTYNLAQRYEHIEWLD